MPDIKFDFRGKEFTAQVPDSFLQRPKVEQQRLLLNNLKKKYDTKIPERGSDEKGILDYLALLERPSQALKVGARESKLGSDIYSALGGVDLTPKEGLFEGFKAGWMGEDEVRTQDFLPDNLNPITKGILGFAGDVATDPLTYVGAGAVRSLGRGIKQTGEVTGATEVLKKTGTKIAEYKLPGKAQVGLPDLARMFNVPMGEGKRVKGTAAQADEILKGFERETAEALPSLRQFFERRAKDTGIASSKLETTFRDAMERPREVIEPAIIDPTTKELIKEGRYGELVPISDEVANELGGDGVKLLSEWEQRMAHLVDVSDAYGMPITTIKNRGYFPRQVTPAGRKHLEGKEDELGFDVGDLGEPVYRAGYRTARQRELAELTTTEYNKEMAEAMARQAASLGRKPNPLDKPYEQVPFFQESPYVALGMRWSRQNKAIQRKWFIDEITDGYRATIGASKVSGNYVPDKGIGKWITKDPEDSANYLERVRTEEGYTTQNLQGSMDEFRKVEGIPAKYESDEVLDQEWRRVFDEELRKKGIFVDVPRGRHGFDRMRLTDDTIKDLGKEYVDAGSIANKARETLRESSKLEFIAPKQVARQIEDHLSLMSGDIRGEKELTKFFRMYDNVQNAWKAWTLGVRPAYHTRNAVGNILNAYTVTGLGENIPEAIKVFSAAAKLQYYSRFGGSQAKRDEVVSNLEGIRVPFEKIPPKINDAEWTKGNFMGTGYSMEQISRMARDRGVTAGHYTADNIRDVERAREAAVGVGSKAARTIGAENPAVQAGFALGGTIEGNARFAVFINTLRKIKKNPKEFQWTTPDGTKISISDAIKSKKYFKTELRRGKNGKLYTTKRNYTREDVEMDIASEQVKASLFDYGDVSKFERDALKRVMPFYTWTRKNIPAQLKSLVLNPQRAEKLAIAKQQFEHETGDLDYSDYGAFWGDRVPVFLGEESQGVIKAFTLLNVAPMADLQRMIKPAPLLAEMGTPLIKAPLEILANYDTFRKGKIAKQPMFTGESKDFLGVSLPPRLHHLAQVLVPLTEINRLNPAGVFGERMKDDLGRLQSTRAYGGMGALRENTIDAPEVARWVRFFSGGTVYDVDLDRHRYIMNKNLKKDIAALKGAIKWAARNSQNDRVKVLYELLEQVQRQEITDPMGQRS